MWNFVKVGLPVVIVIIGALAGCSQKTYHVERVIAAPPGAVWKVLTDTAAYPEWNPVFVKVEGNYAEGGTVQNTFRNPDGNLYDVTNRVVRLVPDKELRQKGGFPGVLTFNHQWLLEPVEGGTRVIQHEVDRGLYVWFWDDSWIIPGYTEVLAALERRVAQRNEDN